MQYTSRFALIITWLILCSCAGGGPLPTPSGYPEVTINRSNSKRIKELLIAHFANM